MNSLSSAINNKNNHTLLMSNTLNIQNFNVVECNNSELNMETSFAKVDADDLKQNVSASIITRFFRRIIAEKCYSFMFNNGENFKLLKYNNPNHSSLKKLDSISSDYLRRIINKTKNITPEESELIEKINKLSFFYRHQTYSKVREQPLILYSKRKLDSMRINTRFSTLNDDINKLSNHDFVFFGVEFDFNENHSPLNKLHNSNDYGHIAFVFDKLPPFGYLTLTDHLENKIIECEHEDFLSAYPILEKEVYRNIHEDKGVFDVPIFNEQDMKLGIGYYLISFLRSSNDCKFKELIFSNDLDNKTLDKIINTIFQPEYHIPRMLITNDFKKIKLREIRLTEAVEASNIEELSSFLHDEENVYEAMKWAIIRAKPDVVHYLFLNYNFLKYKKENPCYSELTFILNRKPTDLKLLKIFLDEELIDLEFTFTDNKGRNFTMLEHAIENSNNDMMLMLKEYEEKCARGPVKLPPAKPEAY